MPFAAAGCWESFSFWPDVGSVGARFERREKDALVTELTAYLRPPVQFLASAADVAEGESEIVAGFHVEYSCMTFAVFFLAEYANMILMSALTTILFLGGWHPRAALAPLRRGCSTKSLPARAPSA